MSIQTIAIGGNNGADFDIQAVHSIGFNANRRIEAVLLNDTRHGDKQGVESMVLELHPEEYINRMVIHDGEHKEKKGIYGIELATNLGRELSAGFLHGKAGKVTTLDRIRVLGLGGSVGQILHKLRVRYIADYEASALIEAEAMAVINVIPQGQTIESFRSTRLSQMNASRRFLETVTNLEQTTEVGAAVGEFTAKASRTFGLTVTTQSEFNKQVEEETLNSERQTYAPPSGHVGLEVVQMDVFKASDGTIWFFPTSDPSIVSAAVSGDNIIKQDLYDMTGTLGLHLPHMAQQQKQSYGYDYFMRPSVKVK
ncbi:MAG: jacalin-like lectin [Paracoccaceae bacterium]